MNELDIKVLFSEYVLGKIQDKGIASTLRYILFATHNDIDWQEAYQVMLTDMPEMKGITMDDVRKKWEDEWEKAGLFKF